MHEQHWLAIMSRISPAEPLDLDGVVFERNGGSVTNISAVTKSMETCHSPKLWQRAEGEVSYIGVRVNQRFPDCTQVAFRLAAAALERGVTPIILATIPDSGFDRFGFRVERITGESVEETSLQEKELSHFWDLAIIIDITDVAALG